MFGKTFVLLVIGSLVGLSSPLTPFAQAVADEPTVFVEQDGILAVEAEHYFEQTLTEVRRFYLTHAKSRPSVEPDGDPPHVGGASNGAYLEILPDTRRTHSDKLTRGENFSPQPGKMAVVHYRVRINQPGRYYVWVRAYSTGSEDNGLHVGLDGRWPASGQRLQWCQGKRTWRWESRQRTEKEHCGERHKIFLDVKRAGDHVISFSMREDGFEFDKWLLTRDRDFVPRSGPGPAVNFVGPPPASYPFFKATPRSESKQEQGVDWNTSPTKNSSEKPLQMPRGADGDGSITVSGELKRWHRITISCQGPYGHELDNAPNPFTDYRLEAVFSHPSGRSYRVPGYFAADGNAGESSAVAGNLWRAHFAPDLSGTWTYRLLMVRGKDVALDREAKGDPVQLVDQKQGQMEVAESDKTGRDLRGKGRLNYVGHRYLQFAESEDYFLKFGADAPETLLAYAEFDDTVGRKANSPLKTFAPHVRDWKLGDPTWQGDKGKGLIGAVNYLSSKGCNAFSFLTYNVGGDGNNIWPFVAPGDKLHYDCSKLDQWEVVFHHATTRGMFLHFKMQETEMDDHVAGAKGNRKFTPSSLDGGNLGRQRKLYCRELVARFGHHLALNWNLGEENTQTTQQQQAMIGYLDRVDAYDHPVVVHTYPGQQDKVYGPLLGDRSKLSGVSLQNSSIADTHRQTLRWVQASAEAGKPWIVAFDESGTAAHGQAPDLGYAGFDGRDKKGDWTYTEHEVRHQTLWGHLMAGGAGCEYYFGYQFAENDLQCEDWRSRDRSWDYGRIALEFFHNHKIPFWEMQNANGLIGNQGDKNSGYCLAKLGDEYVVYLPEAGLHRGLGGKVCELDLSQAEGEKEVFWFNPRTGGKLQRGSVAKVVAGGKVGLGFPPPEPNNLGRNTNDWVVLVR